MLKSAMDMRLAKRAERYSKAVDTTVHAEGPGSLVKSALARPHIPDQPPMTSWPEKPQRPAVHKLYDPADSGQ
jgi:hypothetical protein